MVSRPEVTEGELRADDISLIDLMPQDGVKLIKLIDHTSEATDIADGRIVSVIPGNARVIDVIPKSVNLLDVIPEDTELRGTSMTFGDVVRPDAKLVDVLPANIKMIDLVPGARMIDVVPMNPQRVSGLGDSLEFKSFHFEH
jgi:hypothetical protein